MSDFDAAKADAAGVERVHTGQNLDQRRFAGAVLAQERKNFAGLESHTDVRERFRAAEALEDATDLQQFVRVPPLVRGTIHADDALASLHRLAPPTKRSALADWRARAGPPTHPRRRRRRHPPATRSSHEAFRPGRLARPRWPPGFINAAEANRISARGLFWPGEPLGFAPYLRADALS